MKSMFYECGHRCKSKKHQSELNAAITKGTLKEVQAYFSLCQGAGQLSDSFGRWAIHVASSCGKADVVEWLLAEKHADLGVKDLESGWTALHTAIFYGQLATARLLLQFNVDLNTRDHEGLEPLDIALKDRPSFVSYSPTDQNETYAWGDNTNLTLGHPSEHRRSYAEVVEVFRKHSISIKDVVMCKYHTVFLTQTGQVWTCGHGLGGRLGHGNEETYVIPHLVEAVQNEVCVKIAASRDHTVLLMQSGVMYSFGMNDSHQLGQFPTPPSSKSLLPKQINAKNLRGKNIRGICVGRFHTAVYTSDAVFTFGLNAGQLGHPKGTEKQSQPRVVSNLNQKDLQIEQVSCSDGATVCLTRKGDIYVLHQYQCRKIASRWQEVSKIFVSGGNLDHNTDLEILREKGGSELVILLLNKTGKVFVWRESSPYLKKCRWAIRRQLIIQDVCLSRAGVGIITEEGDGFLGNFITKKSSKEALKTSNKDGGQKDDFGMLRKLDLLLKEEEEDVQIHRIPYIHRGQTIHCDVKGRNFTVLQATPNVCLTDVPVVSSSTFTQDFQQLMEEADEYDLVHDVIIQASGHSWPCHLYILLSRGDHFNKLLAETKKKDTDSDQLIISVNDVHPDILDQLLTFMYTDTCDLLRPGTKFDLKSWDMRHNGDEQVDYSHGDLVISEQEEDKLMKKSAFEVQLLKKKSGGGKENREKGGASKLKNPIKLLQDAAKKFGVKGLSKRLETVKYVNGTVEHAKVHSTVPRMKFERQKLRDIYDVNIQADDETIISCHKCVLVARLEYFHSMLGSGWIETSDTSCLSLPVAGDILQILIDFLYTDDSPVVRESTNPEWLCNILVVADQMLVNRLKEMCEVSIAALVNLKNVAEILEFSFVYNASQLQATCLQFILINMAALLEGRNLEVLSDDVMKEVTKYYSASIPRMCCRVVTPSSEGPSKELLETLASTFDSESSTSIDSFSKKAKQKKRRSRQKSMSEEVDKFGGRDRQISVCSDTSLLSEDDNMDHIVDMLATSPPQEAAMPEISLENKSANATKKLASKLSWKKFGIEQDLTLPVKSTVTPKAAWKTAETQKSLEIKSQQNVGITWAKPTAKTASDVIMPSSPISPLPEKPASKGLSLRDIMEEENSKMKQQNQVKPSKKFSWKDAKKQQGSNTAKSPGNQSSNHDNKFPGATDTTAEKKISCPWGASAPNTAVKSFRDLMVEESSSVTKPIPIQTSGGGAKPKPSTMSWGLPTSSRTRISSTSSFESCRDIVESPPDVHENPWTRSKSATPTSSSLSFSEIIKDEQQKTEVLAKATKKPLSLIQIEEQAIQELLQFYHADEVLDERITVERITQEMATPVWTSKQKSRKTLLDTV